MAAAKGSVLSRRAVVGPGREESAEKANAHHRRHRDIGAAPAHEFRDVESPRTGADQGEAIAELIGSRHHALAFEGRGVDAPAVNDHVLGRRREGDDERRGDGEGEIGCRVAHGDADEARRRHDLRQRHPAPPTPEEPRKAGDVVAVDDRGPQELEGIGERHPAQHADFGARYAGLAKPGRERAEHQKEGQARGKPQRQHQGNAPVGGDVAQFEALALMGRSHESIPYGNAPKLPGSARRGKRRDGAPENLSFRVAPQARARHP